MRSVDIIEKKRAGGAHSRAELEAFIMGYVRSTVPDYQLAAWLMAVCWQGMTPQETADLTAVMAHSGDTLELTGLPHTVDKHSTGGVGDKTSLVLAPLLAACGATVAKMSGRGLGHTGGTVDKLESIPGFRATLDDEAFMAQAKNIGVVVTGQSKDLAPADGLLYALRDATATVQSLPLIASSIMSKKLASGAKSIVLDVKVGSGAFMKTSAEARELASAMIDIGKRAGRNVRAVLSNMEQPLGFAVGNALEVNEALRCLSGNGPADVEALCVTLAEQVLQATGIVLTQAEIAEKLHNGQALHTFKTWIAAQGGEVESLGELEPAPHTDILRAPHSDYLETINALKVGQAVKALGGGRNQKGDALDLRVGVVLHAKVGALLEQDAPLITIHHAERGLAEARELLQSAIGLSVEPVKAPALILETLG